jgi:hypothetical protein
MTVDQDRPRMSWLLVLSVAVALVTIVGLTSVIFGQPATLLVSIICVIGYFAFAWKNS